jgi:hypothetical protein
MQADAPGEFYPHPPPTAPRAKTGARAVGAGSGRGRCDTSGRRPSAVAEWRRPRSRAREATQKAKDRDPRPISAAISWHEQVERAEGDEDDQRGDQRLHGGDRSRDGRRRQCRERDTVDYGSPSPAADVAVPVSVNLPMLINHHISSMIPPEGMARTSRLVARAVVENSPFVRCFRCLSQQAGVPEKDAREAGQRLVRRHEFSIARRECQHCGRIDDVLVSGKAA